MKCERQGCEYTIRDDDKVYEVHTPNWDHTYFTCSLYCANVLRGPNNGLIIGTPRYRGGFGGPDRYALLESATKSTGSDSERGVGQGTVAHDKPFGERGDLGYTFRPRGITGKERRPWLEGDNS